MKKLIFLSILTIFINIFSSDAGDSKKNAETEVAASKSSLTRDFLLNRILAEKGIPNMGVGEKILSFLEAPKKIKTEKQIMGICQFGQGFITLDEKWIV